MKELKSQFPGCILDENGIRESIRKILFLEEEDYNCFECFRYIRSMKFALECKNCFQVYCLVCAEKIKKEEENDAENKNETGNEVEIDPKKCSCGGEREEVDTFEEFLN